MKHDLIDTHMVAHPIRSFSACGAALCGGIGVAKLKGVDTKATTTGVVIATDQPA